MELAQHACTNSVDQQSSSMDFKPTKSPKCPYSHFQFKGSALKLHKVFFYVICNHNVMYRNVIINATDRPNH